MTAVASEFPFREVVGVELSAALAATARANAAVIAGRYPDRLKVRIVEGNVVDFQLPVFGAELVGKIVDRFSAALASGSLQHIFFVYYNPVHSNIFDASPTFLRFYVEQVPYDASEIGFGPDQYGKAYKAPYPRPIHLRIGRSSSATLDEPHYLQAARRVESSRAV